MREYKFRGKRVDNGEWVYFNQYGAYVDENGNELSPKRFTRDCGYKVDPDTVGQCTGLPDKNGKEIYEVDFIKNNQGHVFLVYWDTHDCAFKLDYKYYHHRDGDECHNYLPIYSRSGEIIGNIHDNPELLEAV